MQEWETRWWSTSLVTLLIWLCRVWVAAVGIFSYSLRPPSCTIMDLVPWLGTETGLPVLIVQSVSHWTTRLGSPNLVNTYISPQLITLMNVQGLSISLVLSIESRVGMTPKSYFYDPPLLQVFGLWFHLVLFLDISDSVLDLVGISQCFW